MKTRTRFNTQSRSVFRDRRSTANRTCRTVEDREQAILDKVDLSSTKPFDLFREVGVQPAK